MDREVCFCFVAQDRFTFHFITKKIFEFPLIRETIINPSALEMDI